MRETRRLKKFLLLLSGAMLLASPAYALDFSQIFGDGDCADVRLDDKGKSMENVPALDQLSFGDCYAEVASEMVDAYRFSHGDKRTNLHSEPLMTAIEIGQSKGWKDLDYGYTPCQAVDDFRKNGACNMASVIEKDGETPESYMARYIGFQNSIATLAQSTTANADQISREVSGDSVSICDDLANGGMARGSGAAVSSIQTDLLKNGNVAMMESLRESLCSGSAHFNLQTPLPACNVFSPSEARQPGTFDQTIQWRLNLPNAQPVAISFCSAILTAGRSFQVNLDDVAAGKADASNKCEDHAALVIGSRKNPQTGKCQYLVRNSWGTACEYSKDWQCDTGKGNLWIDRDTLVNNIYRISYF
jgi:hypothetical protein